MLSLPSVELINAEFILTKEGYALHPNSSKEIKEEYARRLEMQDKKLSHVWKKFNLVTTEP